MKPKTTLTVRWRIRCQGALGPSPVKSLDDEEAAKTKLAEVRGQVDNPARWYAERVETVTVVKRMTW
jgi:hypothetical protein